MTSEPLVGVVVCTYKKPERLKNALNAIKSQTYSNYFVVVIDDCSDCSHENQIICNSFQGKIEYICNSTNLGISRTRNEGLKYLVTCANRPKFICMLDDDDYWPTDRLALGVSAMKPGVGMSYGIQHMTDELLRPILKYPCNVSYRRALLHAVLFGEFFFPAKTYMFDISFIEQLNLAPLSWYYHHNSREDVELGIRALRYAHNNSRWETTYINRYLASWIQSRGLMKFKSKEYFHAQMESHKTLVKEYIPYCLHEIAITTSPYTFRLPQFLKFGFI